MYKLLTIDKIKPGTIIVDRKSNKFLIIGLKKDKNCIDCLDETFTDISIGLDWIDDYLIYDTIDLAKMIEWMKSYDTTR